MRYEYNLETGEMIELEDALPSPEQPKIEITQVSMRQCRLALLQENQLYDVEELILTKEQHIWWDYSTTVEKYNPLVQAIKAARGWTDDHLTHLFDLAITL